MSNKICPKCKTTNSSANIKCIKCTESMLYVPVEKEWTEEHEKQPFRKIYMLDEFKSFSFILRVIICITFSYIAMLTHNPLFMAISIIVLGTFFLPKDFDYLSPTDWHDYFLIKKQKNADLQLKNELKKENIVKSDNRNNKVPITLEDKEF